MIVLGIDIGQSQDYTAIVAVDSRKDSFHLRHLERLPLGTPYTAVVNRIEALVGVIPGSRVVLDSTGVGRPVLDSLRATGLEPIAVTITGGRNTRQENGIHYVPKRDLVLALITALENGRLRIARNLPLVPALLAELANFEVTVSARGYDRYEAARGHDDLVVAVALAVWASGL